jgi:hypothetical protein
MEQLGCLLLGFTVAVPVVLMIWAATCEEKSRGMVRLGDQPRRQRTAPLVRCDPSAVAEYFGTLPRWLKTDSLEPLSLADLIALVGGADSQGSLPVPRFDKEGGYRLVL